MASSVFFKFKSQKEPQRVTFDGTGITVFELKREIINITQLGDGTGFDLSIYNEDTNEEYADDTEIIARSSSVTARRLPASKPGQGKAARYVSGRMPAAARNTHRPDQSHTLSSASKPATAGSGGATAMDKAQTEEEKIAAMHQMGADQWEQQKQQMAGATPVFRPGMKGKAVNVPEHKPPAGYICYRCHEKGHWIQACPTNNDPNFDGRPRVKRTTGIPRSMLQTVEKPSALNNDGLTDDSRQPSGVMVNAEGDYVVAVPDKASWEQYQAKAQASAAHEDVADTGDKELQERGLECPIDKRLFVNPMKTPCCSRTFCYDCIENALLNSDLVCPGCSTEGVLIDNLVPDEETSKNVKAYEDEKKAEKQAGDVKAQSSEQTKEDVSNNEKVSSSTSTPAPEANRSASPNKSPGPENPKKRSAEETLSNERKQPPAAPVAMQKSNSNQSKTAPAQNNVNANGFDQSFIDQMNALAGNQPQSGPNAFPNMNFNNGMPSMPAFPNGMGSMPPMMPPMPMQMMNPAMMQQWMNNMNNPAMMNGMPDFNAQQWNGPNAMFSGPQGGNWQGGSGWGGANSNNNMMGSSFNNQPQQQQQPPPQQQQQQRGGKQFRYNGAAAQNDDDDSAYMRKPVNPHRHQGRQKKVRPMDYREL